MNSFQTILLVLFGSIAVIGTIVFSGFFSSEGGGSASSKLEIWGTLPEKKLALYLTDFNKRKLTAPLSYKQYDESSFERILVDALAEGRGPDLVILPHDLLVRHQAKISPVSYEALPARTFADTFIDAGSIYSGIAGTLGFPLFVDPLMLYWNKDLFTSAELVQAPTSWEQALGITRRLTKIDASGTITRSAISLGNFANIPHAKEIMAALFLQSGDNIVVRDTELGAYVVTLGDRRSGSKSGAESALRFFTEFSNPSKPDTYTWNNSLRSSERMFTDGALAMYLAPWSEHAGMRERNPHLNFDIAILPQRETGQTRSTYGRLYALAPLKSSRASGAAITAAATLSQAQYVDEMVRIVSLPPARRDLLAGGAPDPDLAIAYRSAIIARGWLDPSPGETEKLFQTAIEAVTSGSMREDGAVILLAGQMQELLPEEAR